VEGRLQPIPQTTTPRAPHCHIAIEDMRIRTFQELTWPGCRDRMRAGGLLIYVPSAGMAYRCELGTHIAHSSCVTQRLLPVMPSHSCCCMPCRLARFVAGQGLACGALTEELSPEQIERVASEFRCGKLQVGGWAGCRCTTFLSMADHPSQWLTLGIAGLAFKSHSKAALPTQALVFSEAAQAVELLTNAKVGCSSCCTGRATWTPSCPTSTFSSAVPCAAAHCAHAAAAGPGPVRAAAQPAVKEQAIQRLAQGARLCPAS